MAHRPVEPGIAARIGRPDALDEAADDDAVDGRQARFERTVDAHAALRRAGPAHHAVADDDAEQLHIVGRLDHERLRLLGDVGEGGVERHAVGAGERGGHVVGVEARADDRFAMACGERGEILLAGRRHALERRQRRGDALEQQARAMERRVRERGTRLRAMDRGQLAGAELRQLRAGRSQAPASAPRSRHAAAARAEAPAPASPPPEDGRRAPRRAAPADA